MRYLALLFLLLAVPCWADEEEAIAALKTSGVVFKGTVEARKIYIVIDEHDLSPERAKRLSEVSGITAIYLIDRLPRQSKLLPVVKKLEGVKHLELSSVNGAFTDADLKHVAEMSALETIYIGSQSITDKGLMELAKIKGLKQVTVRSDKVTQAGREKLNDALPKCVVK